MSSDDRKYFPEDYMQETPETAHEFRRARRFGTLVYADRFMFCYHYNGKLWVTQPPESLRDVVTELTDWHEEQETAHSEKKFDGAVLAEDNSNIADVIDDLIHKSICEAGFATEEIRAVLKDVVELLYTRMLSDPIKGFTNFEWVTIDKACELLGIDRKHR